MSHSHIERIRKEEKQKELELMRQEMEKMKEEQKDDEK